MKEDELLMYIEKELRLSEYSKKAIMVNLKILHQTLYLSQEL